MFEDREDLTTLETQIENRLNIPHSEELPVKRFKERLLFRNERNLYKRESSLSKKPIISIYSPSSAYQIYANEEWWSDAWDPLSFGKEYNFNRPFFEQFQELQLKVPRIALFNINPDNSDYCQQAYDNKNCYLCFVIKDGRDSMYVSHSNKVTDTFDCDYVQKVELCYQCFDCENMYACVGCENCQNSNELFWCIDCIGCNNCIGSYGLRNQSYCIFNEQYSKENYLTYLKELNLSSFSGYQLAANKIKNKLAQEYQREIYTINCEDCVGNLLINCKNCDQCYDSFKIEMCTFCTWTFESNYCAHIYGMGTSEWVYESLGVEDLHYSAYCTFVSSCSEAYYSDLCFNSQNIFGCVGTKRLKYCILNKEYSEEEYFKLKALIIEQMKKTNEWGKFFPKQLSPFAYNESVAQEKFPLNQESALANGYLWQEENKKDYQKQTFILPDDLKDTSEDVCKAILSCEMTGKNYKIIPQELEFYKKINLPIPRFCPDARYVERMKKRNK